MIKEELPDVKEVLLYNRQSELGLKFGNPYKNVNLLSLKPEKKDK